MHRRSGLSVAVLLALLVATRTSAQPVPEAAASNASSIDSDALMATLSHTPPRAERRTGQEASVNRRRAVRTRLETAKARRGWWSDAYRLAASRVRGRFLAETGQNVSQPSLQQLYAGATQQLQAKAALLQSYADQAAQVSVEQFGSSARVAQVQLKQSGTPPAPHREGAILILIVAV